MARIRKRGVQNKGENQINEQNTNNEPGQGSKEGEPGKVMDVDNPEAKKRLLEEEAESNRRKLQKINMQEATDAAALRVAKDPTNLG